MIFFSFSHDEAIFTGKSIFSWKKLSLRENSFSHEKAFFAGTVQQMNFYLWLKKNNLTLKPKTINIFSNPDQRVRWRVIGNRFVDVIIVGIMHLPNHQIVYKVQIIDYVGKGPKNENNNHGINTIHYIAVPPETNELSEVREFSEGTSYACPFNTKHNTFSLTSELREHLAKEHGLVLPGDYGLINDYINGLHEIEPV